MCKDYIWEHSNLMAKFTYNRWGQLIQLCAEFLGLSFDKQVIQLLYNYNICCVSSSEWNFERNDKQVDDSKAFI